MIRKFPNNSLIEIVRIQRPLSQATASNRPNVFTFTLPLSEGRMCGAWEPSNEMMSFLPPSHDTIKFLLVFS
jgi:hypothetical protein